MCHAMRRLVVMLVGLLVVTACGPTPRPFEHDDSVAPMRRLPHDTIELAVSPPRNMPTEMGQRVAAALAVELQSYGSVAAAQPGTAAIHVNGVTSTRAAEPGIQIQIHRQIERALTSQ